MTLGELKRFCANLNVDDDTIIFIRDANGRLHASGSPVITTGILMGSQVFKAANSDEGFVILVVENMNDA